MHRNNIKLVYGGGTRGIMGEIAKTLISLSGPEAVHGIIPRALIRVEEGYDGTSVSAAGGASNKGVETGDSLEKTKTEERVMDTKALSSSNKNGTSSDGPEITKIHDSEFGTTTVVPDMHTRKRLMASEVISGGPGSGFVALAGGYGTLEEVAEMTTWNQLGIHRSGIVLVNIDGCWDGVIEWIRRSVKEGFVGEGNKDIVVEVKKVEDVVPALKEYTVAEGRFKLDWSQG